MSANDSSSEKTENFENIDPSEIPGTSQQQPMQVGSYMERSYSADELEEPMKVYPRTSERANEGQELTVRKRLMLTETEESTLDEQRDASEAVESGREPGTEENLVPKISASPVQSPSPALVSNKLGDDLGDTQNYGVEESHESPQMDQGPASNVSNHSQQEVQVVPVAPGAAGALDNSNILLEKSETEIEGDEGNGLMANGHGSNSTFGPTENSQEVASSLKDITVPRNTIQSSEQPSDGERLTANIDQGPSKDGTHGASAAQPNSDPEMYNDFRVMDSGHQNLASAPGGRGAPESGSGQRGVYGSTLHPIENSRQKWELTGGAEDEDINLDEETGANAVAIAPMRLSMTNESEIEIQSLDVNPETGNNDDIMGLQEAENPNVDVESVKSMGKPEEVQCQEAEEALRCPSQLSAEERNITLEPSDEPADQEATSSPGPSPNLGPTVNISRDGSSVDTQSSGAPAEYVFNIEDARPPWLMEGHTHVGSSKTQQTPRCVKSYDEEVNGAQDQERDEPVPEIQEEQEEPQGVSQDAATPSPAADQSADAEGTREESTPDKDSGEPRLFQRNLQEMSEVMNSVDNAQSIPDTISADTCQEEENVEAEDQNMKTITPPPSMEEPSEKTKDLQEEHSLTKSDSGSQPEQHANRRILAKPLETSCPSCDFVASDQASSVGGSSTSSKKYSYAKSKSQQSIELNFTEDERLESPNEGVEDTPEDRPAPEASEIEIITNESTGASETIPAEKEGDMDFHVISNTAEPIDHNRSIDQDDKNLEPSQPTQRQCSLMCIDDDDSSDEGEGGALINLDDSRNSLWVIQPKEHRRKSSQNREPISENQNEEDRDEYEPEGPNNEKRRKPSDPDSGHGTRRSKYSPRNPSFQSSRNSSNLPRGRAHNNVDENGEPIFDSHDSHEHFGEDNDMSEDYFSSEDTHRKSSGVSIIQTSESTFVPVDLSGNLLHGAGSFPSEDASSNDSGAVMNPGSRDSHGSVTWNLTPINEERTRSQNIAELSAGCSFHSCEENLPSPIYRSVLNLANVEDAEFEKYHGDSQHHPLQFHKSLSPSSMSQVETPMQLLEQKAFESENVLDNIKDSQIIEPATFLKEKQEESGTDFSNEVQFGNDENGGVKEIQADPQMVLGGLEDECQTIRQSTVNLQFEPVSKYGTGSQEPSEELPIGDVPDAVNTLTDMVHSCEEKELANLDNQSELFYKEKSNVSPPNDESVDLSVEAGSLITAEAAIKSPMNNLENVEKFAPEAKFAHQALSGISDAASNEGLSSKSVELMNEQTLNKAGVETFGMERRNERYSVDAPRASTTEKCIITKQRVKPVALDEFTQVMETPRFGPEEHANERSFSFCEGPAAVEDVNTQVIGNQTAPPPGDYFGSFPQREPDYENLGDRARQNNKLAAPQGGLRSSLNDSAKSPSGSMLKLSRRSTQSLSDGMSFASQSVRGSQFAIDMRPDSTPSMNIALNMEKSMPNEVEAGSIPATPNGHFRPIGGVAMRASSFKPRSTTPGSSRMYLSNSKLAMGSVVNTPKTPATVDLSLASPRDMSLQTVVSSQSLERQIRITRVRATSRRGGDEGSRASGVGSRASKNSRSPSKRTAGSKFGGKRTLSIEREVASGDERNGTVTKKEKKSNEHEIVAQVGHGYVTQKDIPLIGPL